MIGRVALTATAAAAGLAAAVVGAAASPAAAACKIEMAAELKVDPATRRPRVEGAIGGRPVTVLIDSGAWATGLTLSAAERLGLRATGSPVRSYGVGGVLDTRAVPVTAVRIGAISIARMLMPVTQGEADVDMLLGDDILNDYDVEFDLKGGAVRLLRMSGCSDDETPYWSRGAYTVLPLDYTGANATQQYVLQVKLNGRPVKAMIDSGASATVMTPNAARLAHAEVTAGHESASGLSGRALPVSIARLDTVSVGDETVHNVHLQVADLGAGVAWADLGSRIERAPLDETEMLLGADFLLSHRVLLSSRRSKAFITYVGGPVFSPSPSPSPSKAKAPAPVPTPAPPPAAASDPPHG